MSEKKRTVILLLLLIMGLAFLWLSLYQVETNFLQQL